MNYLQQNIELNRQNGALLEAIKILEQKLNKKVSIINTQKQTISELMDKNVLYRTNCLDHKKNYDKIKQNISIMDKMIYNV